MSLCIRVTTNDSSYYQLICRVLLFFLSNQQFKKPETPHLGNRNLLTFFYFLSFCHLIKHVILAASLLCINLTIVHTLEDATTISLYLFSVEQKNVTQGLRTLLSDDGGRYMASEKQVSNNLSNSVLKRWTEKRVSPMLRCYMRHMTPITQPANSPVQVMDIVERWGLCKAHSCLPDVFTAVYRLHILYRVLDVVTNQRFNVVHYTNLNICSTTVKIFVSS